MAGAALIRGVEAQASAALIYSLGVDCHGAQSLVQDAVASPPRRLCSRVRKRARTIRGRGRRRSYSSGSEEDFSDGNGGNGNGAGDNGSGGGGSSDWWGESWSDDGSWWWWRDEGSRRALLSFFHQVACWVCLLQSLHFLVKNVIRLSQGGDPYGSGETTSVLSH